MCFASKHLPVVYKLYMYMYVHCTCTCIYCQDIHCTAPINASVTAAVHACKQSDFFMGSQQQQSWFKIAHGSSSFTCTCMDMYVDPVKWISTHDYFPRLGQMFHCYKKCKEIGAIAQVHAENGTLIAEVK